MAAVGCGAQGINHGGGGTGGTGGGGGTGGTGGSGGTGGTGGSGGGQGGCGGGTCYTVYAHADHVLYSIDLMAKSLVTVGPFKAPMVGTSEDTITDLAVGSDNTIYVVSKTNLYTASPTDGHVTLLGAIGTCGSDNVALSLTPGGQLVVGDFKGAMCHIDTTKSPPTVTQVGTLGQGMALSGDLVAVADGTVYGSAYLITDGNSKGTGLSNVLVKLDPTTGQMLSQIGPTGFPKLFGIAYALGQVFGFTHDGSGDVVSIDPMTGKGTLFNSFKDPSTNTGISFAGAGVNPMVSPIP